MFDSILRNGQASVDEEIKKEDLCTIPVGTSAWVDIHANNGIYGTVNLDPPHLINTSFDGFMINYMEAKERNDFAKIILLGYEIIYNNLCKVCPDKKESFEVLLKMNAYSYVKTVLAIEEQLLKETSTEME